MNRHPVGVRPAFTFVELLVVLCIVAALVALFFPALQQLRESAHRLHCANNLKQLGLAFQAHHSQHDFFPTAGTSWNTPPTFLQGNPEVGSKQHAGWGYQILPYIEGGAVAWQGGDGTNDNDRQRAAVGYLHKFFFCPTRRRPMTLTYADGYISKGPTDTVRHALCDYAANNLDEDTGAIRANKFGPPLRLADIVDGISTTLLISEKRMNHFYFGERRLDDNQGFSAGNDWDTMRNANLPPALDVDSEGTEKGFREFGSAHSTGLNVLFVDGSVRFTSFNISPGVFARLGTRAE